MDENREHSDVGAVILGLVMRHWRECVRNTPIRPIADQLRTHFTNLARWERGERLPPKNRLRELDAAYGTGDLLASIYALVTRMNTPAELEIRDVGILDRGAPIRSNHGDDDMERRAAMRLLAALGAGAAIPAGSLESLFSGVDFAIGGREGLGVDDWEQVVWEHGLTYPIRPSAELVGRTTADLAEISRLLGRATSPEVRTGLLRSSAELATLLGMELDDVGQHDAASRSWIAARRAADAADDRDLRVWVRAREAMYAYWSDRPHQVASRLADDAVQIADGVPSSGLARALGVQAFLAASQGDAARAWAALDELRRTYDRLPASVTSDNSTTPLWSFSERRMLWAIAYPSALIGEPAKVDKAVNEALPLYPDTFAGDRVDLHLMQVLGGVRDANIQDGLAQAVTVSGQWPIGASRRRIIGQIIGSLPDTARTLPAATHLREMTA
ncbi:XRE family transcriptional regulator [Nonomuraea longicatena]|uniref:XRE family transcriptional regulator n=1 Tax=Nonomuraea longicatena TaxID=83682 RepID=A0ABN1QPV3_9ACTN